MVALNCESCGAPLKVTQENIVICEYCGNETIIAKTTADPSENLIASIPSCGASVFDKKTFNIYKQFAELVDDESGKVEQHIDFKQVKKYKFFLNTNLVFTLYDGQQIYIRFIWSSKTKISISALDVLI